LAFIRRQRRRRGNQIGCLLLWVAGFAFLERAAEAVGLGAGLDEMRAVGDTVDKRLAQPGVGNNLRPLENNRLVVTITAAFSARSAMTWNRNSAPTSANGTYPTSLPSAERNAAIGRVY
jgi:hypothetical protein